MDSSGSEIAPDIMDRIRAAEGWLGLGDYNSASEELDSLPHEAATHFETLKIRCAIYRKAKRWQDLQTLAKGCVEMYPNVAAFHVDYARALDTNGDTGAALSQLLSVKDRFLISDALAYYLACFLAKMERLDEAREWLRKAFERAENKSRLQLKALEQPELKAIWKS